MATIAKKIPHVSETNTHHLVSLYSNDLWFDKATKAYFKLTSPRHYKKIGQEIGYGVARGLSDSAITNNILSRYWNRAMRNDDDSSRAKYRASEISRILEQVDTTPITRYVDFGCGDRTITEAVGAAYELAPRDIIGVDIFDSHSPGSTFYPSTADVATASIDLITAFVSLHHVIDQQTQINDLARILRPGGVLIIREHDLAKSGDAPFMRDYLQLIHIISAAWDTAGDLRDILATTVYHSKFEWAAMMARAGLTESFYPTESQVSNPQGLYYGAYWRVPHSKK